MNYLMIKSNQKQTIAKLLLVSFLGFLLIPSVVLADEDEAPPSGRTAGGRGCERTSPIPESEVPSVILLTPPGRSNTVSTRPSFAWFVRDVAPVTMEFKLYAKAENNRYKLIKEIKDERLKTVSGIMILSTAQTTPELGIGQYRWQVVLVCDRSHPSSNLFAESELDVVPMPLQLKTRLEKALDPFSQALIYVQANYWYDALRTTISPSANNTGGNSKLNDPRLALFDKVMLNKAERELVQNSKVHFIQR